MGFDYTNQWYINKPETVLQQENIKILWDFEIQIDDPTQNRL